MKSYNSSASNNIKDIDNQDTKPEGIVVSLQAREALSKTRVWLQTISSIIFILSGIQILLLIIQLSSKGNFKMGIFMALLLAVVFYVYMAIKLIKYKRSIAKLLITNDPQDFEKAMAINLSFWDLMTLLSIVVIVTVLIIVIK